MSTQFRDVNRTATAGDLVISVAEIFDRLQSRVDPNTLEQLLRDIISGRRNQVRPGELITAELMNQVLAQLESLETRVLALETSSPGGGPSTGTTPATGFIDVRYKESSRGTQVVPGETNAFPHTFTLSNNTDRTLTIQVDAAVTAPRGTWTNSVQVVGAEASLASGTSRDFTVNVRAPADATIGDAIVLRVEATVGSPHNKLARRELPLTIAAAGGAPVTHSVVFNQALQPSGGTNNVAPGAILSYTFDVRYAATQAPFSTPFRCTATLTTEPSDSIAEWFVDFTTGTTTNVSPGVIATALTLDTNATADTRIIVRVRAPFARSTTGDKTATLTVRLDSTDTSLTPSVSAISGPFNVRLQRG